MAEEYPGKNMRDDSAHYGGFELFDSDLTSAYAEVQRAKEATAAAQQAADEMQMHDLSQVPVTEDTPDIAAPSHDGGHHFPRIGRHHRAQPTVDSSSSSESTARLDDLFQADADGQTETANQTPLATAQRPDQASDYQDPHQTALRRSETNPDDAAALPSYVKGSTRSSRPIGTVVIDGKTQVLFGRQNTSSTSSVSERSRSRDTVDADVQDGYQDKPLEGVVMTPKPSEHSTATDPSAETESQADPQASADQYDSSEQGTSTASTSLTQRIAERWQTRAPDRLGYMNPSNDNNQGEKPMSSNSFETQPADAYDQKPMPESGSSALATQAEMTVAVPEKPIVVLANGKSLSPLPQVPSILHWSERSKAKSEVTKLDYMNSLLSEDAQYVNEPYIEPYSLVPVVQGKVIASVQSWLPPQVTEEVGNVLKMFAVQHGQGTYLTRLGSVDGLEAIETGDLDINPDIAHEVPYLVAHRKNVEHTRLAEMAHDVGLEAVIEPDISIQEATLAATEAIGLSPEFQRTNGDLYFDGFALTDAILKARTQRAALQQRTLSMLSDPANIKPIDLDGEGEYVLGTRVLVDRPVPSRVTRKIVTNSDHVVNDVGTRHDGMAIVRDGDEQRYLMAWDQRLTQAAGTEDYAMEFVNGVEQRVGHPTQELLVRVAAVALNESIVDFVRSAVAGDTAFDPTQAHEIAVGTKIGTGRQIYYDMEDSNEWLTNKQSVGVRGSVIDALSEQFRQIESGYGDDVAEGVVED